MKKDWRGKVHGERYIQLYASSYIQFYLGAHPMFLEESFRGLFRVPRTIFVKLYTDLVNGDSDFSSTRTDVNEW